MQVLKFIKNNYILILILLLGAFLRINTDTFLSGYNYDEFAIVSIAKLDFLKMFRAIAQEDYHAPFYYIISHFFANSGHAYVWLRLLNIFFSLCNIFVFYKIANLLINKQAGLFAALFLAVNHFEISIANFIKFYCLDCLLVSLSVYFLLSYIKNNKKHLLALGLVSCIIPLSFTFGYIFCAIEYLFLYLFTREKEVIKSFLFATIGFVIYLPILIIQTKAAFSNILSAHGSYPSLSFFAFYSFLSDYFSPLVNYACNVETVESIALLEKSVKCIIEKTPFDYISFISFVLLSVIPCIICIFGIINFCKKDKNALLLFKIALVNTIFMIILVKLEITGFIPTYFFPSGMILILLAPIGLFLVQSRAKYFLLGYVIFVHLMISNVYPLEKREFITKIYGNIDSYIEEIDKNTPIIMLDGARFAKYYYKDKNVFALDYEQIEGTNSRKMIEVLYGKDIAQKANKKNYKELISPIILNNLKTGTAKEFLEKNLFSKVKKGEKIVLIFNSDGSPFILADNEIEKNLKKEYDYHLQNSTLIFQLKPESQKPIGQVELAEIVLSYSTKLIINEIEKEFKIVKIEQMIPSKSGKYKKNYETDTPDFKTLDLMSMSALGWIFVTYEKR